jgi:hypothetical protein
MTDKHFACTATDHDRSHPAPTRMANNRRSASSTAGHDRALAERRPA